MARTAGEAFNYAAEAEEALWLAERDKAALREFVEGAVQAIRKSRREPCPAWKFWCKE